jgi:hypothetical protein
MGSPKGSGSRFQVQGSKVPGSGFKGSGFRVQGSKVQGSRFSAVAGLKNGQSNQMRN